MTTEAITESPSEVLQMEVEQLETELEKLQDQRQKLVKFPEVPEKASPGEIAKSIADSVTSNAPRLRAIDAAIAALTQRLTSKQSQLAQELEGEQKQLLQQRMDEIHAEMATVCACINQASDYIEEQIIKLKTLEGKLIPLRWRQNPYGAPYPHFVLPPEVTVPKATSSGSQTVVESRLLS